MMREALEVLLDNLRALRRDGETEVFVEEATLEELRACVAKVAGRSRGGAGRGSAEVAGVSGTPTVRRETEPQNFVRAEARASGASAGTRKIYSRAAGVAASAANVGGIDFSDFDESKSAVRAAGVPATGTKVERLAVLRELVYSDPVCNRHLRAGKKLVFGEGNPEAAVFFCGEAPGKDEETLGRPFVGAAGKLLDKMIAAAALVREDVYIANVLQWRPETTARYGDRTPSAEEIAYGMPYLAAQAEIVCPRVIVALGKTALNGLFGYDPARRMSEMRGRRDLRFRGIPVVATFHPSYLLRSDSIKSKREAWEDFLIMMEIAELPITTRQRNYFLRAVRRGNGA